MRGGQKGIRGDWLPDQGTDRDAYPLNLYLFNYPTPPTPWPWPIGIPSRLPP